MILKSRDSDKYILRIPTNHLLTWTLLEFYEDTLTAYFDTVNLLGFRFFKDCLRK